MHGRAARGSPVPFSSSQVLAQRACLHSRNFQSNPHRQSSIQTPCAAHDSQGVGRRWVGGVAAAGFLTWALQSASAKSMKPGEVQKRSRDEESAAFENRQGEVLRFSILLMLAGHLL